MRTLMLLMVLCGVAAAQTGGGGEPKPKTKSELEKLLEEALKGHPDIGTAEAKVLLARAELEKARREIAHKVVAAYHAAQASRDMLTESKRRLKAIMDARAKVATAFSIDDVMIAQLTVSRYENEVKGAEAALAVLTGKGDSPAALKLDWARIAFSPDGGRLHTMDGHGTVRIWDARTGKEVTGTEPRAGVTGTMADRIRAALDKKLTLKFEAVDLADALSYLGKTSGLHIRGPAAKGTVTTGDVGEVTFGAACQLIEDTLPGHRFVVREYGVLFVPEDKIPPGAVTLMAFWKGGAARADAARKDVEGKVTQVADKGLLKLDIGSDAGVAKGDVLEVFRLGAESKYLGKVRVVEVTAKESVARTEGKPLGNFQAGDRVASKIVAGR